MIVVNFKTYPQGSGEMAVELAKVCKAVADKTGVRIIAVPQLGDLARCKATGVECWAQHVDAAEQGKFTGWVTVEEISANGATGTLLNHAEHQIAPQEMDKIIQRIRQIRPEMEICICANDLQNAVHVSGLQPNYVAYEPPELIGSKDKSVATESPEVIEQAVQSTTVPILIGAGVHSGEDVKTGLKLGARGVLLATDVVLAEDPEKQLQELAEAFKI
jgi:triosephosphate isomerase (TIM)